MRSYRTRLKSAITKKYGSVNKWLETEAISSQRFYDFLNGEYHPTVKTLEKWAKSAGLVLDFKKINTK
jgi:hypothetical protein